MYSEEECQEVEVCLVGVDLSFVVSMSNYERSPFDKLRANGDAEASRFRVLFFVNVDRLIVRIVDKRFGDRDTLEILFRRTAKLQR